MTSLLKEQVIVHFGFNYLADKTWNILPGFLCAKLAVFSVWIVFKGFLIIQ